MRLRCRIILFVLATFMATSALRAQVPVTLGSEQEEYYRFLELEGRLANAPLAFRSPSRLSTVIPGAGPWAPYSDSAAADGVRRAHGGVQLILPAGHLVYNSRYPRGINDGAPWAGRGVSGDLTAGAQLSLGPVSATIAPTLWYAQNRDFDTITAPFGNRSPLAYPWSDRIDWPQRFGSNDVTAVDWGQSGVRLDLSWFTAGFSTENQWWGPTFRNPLLMSNTAAGFPHVDLGIGRPTSVGVGQVEARLIWGRLAESDYFDTVSTNNGRLFSGTVIGFQPRWVPGLTLGVARLLYTTWNDSLRLADFTDVFLPVFKERLATPGNPTGDDNRDQLLSVFFRWLLPESGFESYIEWGWNDHRWDQRDFILEPDHAEGWAIGFRKSFPSAGGRVGLRAEATHLGRSPTFLVREEPTFYVHHLVKQGYTQRGQIVGAGIGPGSDGQYLGLDRYYQSGRWGFFFQRVRYNNDAYYALFGPTRSFDGHNVEMTAGASVVRFMGDYEITLQGAFSREFNRHYVVKNDVTNVSVGASVRWLRAR